ncbi:MAG: nucleotidyltransferase substrate binding protein [Clostridiaceae bacterium]|nr:nucleotidyltransferase substrate binding protein [Clostridiaceae bacterium]
MSKLETKLISFDNALNRLKEAIEELENHNASNVVRDGVIQRFEFTYELAWKTTKEYLENIGIVDRTSPKTVIKEAFAQKLITDEKSWLMMINDRNLASHVYKEEMAEEIAKRIINNYITEFENLLIKLQK